MLVKPLYRDPATGQILQVQPGDVLDVPAVSIVQQFATLLNAATVNTCCALLDQNASLVTSFGSSNPSFRPIPYVDCIVLEAGLPGQTVLVAQDHGLTYTTNIPLTYATSGILYLGQDGKPTTTKPSLINGDKFEVVIGRLVNANHFIFAPEPPIDLNATSGGGSGSLPSTIGHEKAVLYTKSQNVIWKPLYVSDINPDPAILTFATPALSLEVGQSITAPSFTATYNEDPISITFKDSSSNVSVSPSNINSFASAYTFSLNTPGFITFTLTANYPIPSIQKLNITWMDRIYYGHLSSLSAITSLQANLLASNVNNSYTVNAGPNEYIYFAIPETFDIPRFSVNGFQGGFSLISNLTLTNQYGIEVDYNIFRSDNHSLGLTTVMLL